MPTEIQVIDHEIPYKGKCYLICTAYDAADFSAVLASLVETAERRGAAEVYFACRDKRAELPEDGFAADGVRFVPDGVFYMDTKDLSALADGSMRPLRLKALTAMNAPLYMALFNEAFFDVPNSMTVDDAEIANLLGDEKRRAGFLMEGGLPVGIFELSFADSIPEIAAVGIRPELCQQGYGRRALITLEQTLRAEGFRKAKLLVSSKNERALRLYASFGYGERTLLSRWYRAERLR